MNTLRQYSSSTLSLSDDFFADTETPLTVFGSQLSEDMLIISPNVIKTYRQIIFRLELQVLRYEALFRQLERSRVPVEELAVEPSQPLNAASVQFVNSILHSRISEHSILRAFDDEED